MSEKRRFRFVNMMVEQQICHLGMSLDEYKDKVKTLGASRFATVVHDRDTKTDGAPVEPHVHTALHFSNAREISAVAKKLGLPPQYVNKWDGDQEALFAYLCHRTSGAKARFQYEPADVEANFDYASWLAKVEARYKAADSSLSIPLLGGSEEKVDAVLNALYAGDLTEKEAGELLTGSEYGNNSRALKDVIAAAELRSAERWREERKDVPLTVLWLYGPSYSGKSHLAIELAARRGDYYVSRSRRDPWAEYHPTMHSVVLDDLRPDSMDYVDLLKCLDPNSLREGASGAARYRDRPLACDFIVITTPFTPLEFWEAAVKPRYRAIDGLDQLHRRLTTVISMDQRRYRAVSFDSAKGVYRAVRGTSRKNIYAARGRTEPTAKKARDAFKALGI